MTHSSPNNLKYSSNKTSPKSKSNNFGFAKKHTIEEHNDEEHGH